MTVEQEQQLLFNLFSDFYWRFSYENPLTFKTKLHTQFVVTTTMWRT